MSCVNLCIICPLEEENGETRGEEEGDKEEVKEAEEEGRDSEEDEVDLRRYRPAGGPIVLTLLELPPPPKNTGQWTIRRGSNNTVPHNRTKSFLSVCQSQNVLLFEITLLLGYLLHE